MASGPGQNATVEEILASIRQAISEDDTKRTSERVRGDTRAPSAKRPVASVSEVFPEKETVVEEQDITVPQSEPFSADQDVIELAIEQALDGVRAELEGARAAQPRAASRPRAIEDATSIRSSVRQPRIGSTTRREVPPAAQPQPQPQRRALMSPRSDAQVSASFDDLAKAMIEGNARQLDEVVEDLLRPMLKGWLDNNLPQMVERLVREEIERVARGGRR